MIAHGHRIAFAVLLLACSFCLRTAAQQRNCAGIVQSYSRMGLYYERYTKEGSFMSWNLCAETAEMFSGNAPYPGVSLSFGWNVVISEKELPDGNRIVFFAGPGAAVGLCRDLKSPPGLYFGLQGMAGVYCRCGKNVDISASVAPVLGIHSVRNEESLRLKYFKYGLIRTLIPEIRIGYRF